MRAWPRSRLAWAPTSRRDAEPCSVPVPPDVVNRRETTGNDGNLNRRSEGFPGYRLQPCYKRARAKRIRSARVLWRVATGASRAERVAMCGQRVAAIRSAVLTVAGPVVSSAGDCPVRWLMLAGCWLA